MAGLVLPVAIAAICLIGNRVWLGFQFPVPWNDETQFISPAFELARHGTMFVPGLDPDRVLMAQPPGYEIILAAMFRLFGYGYGLARWVSTLSMTGALAIGVYLASSLTPRAATGALSHINRLAAFWAIGLAFAAPSLLVSANLARMEAPFCLVVMTALLAGVAGRIWTMGALVVLSATLHFNAIWFVPAVALDLLVRLFGRRLPRPDRTDIAAMTFTILCVAGSLIFIAWHWAGFCADMAEQFTIKHRIAGNDPTQPLALAATATALAVLALAIRRRFDRAVLTAAFGAGFVWMAHEGGELWYDYGDPLGFALITLALCAPAPSGSRRPVPLFAATIALAMTAWMSARVTSQLDPFMPHAAWFTRDYLRPGSRQKVQQFLATLPPGQAIDFGFNGTENFFLADLDAAGAHWTRINHSFFIPTPFRGDDWRISCDSPDLDRRLRLFEMTIQREGRDTGCTVLPGLHS